MTASSRRGGLSSECSFIAWYLIKKQRMCLRSVVLIKLISLRGVLN